MRSCDIAIIWPDNLINSTAAFHKTISPISTHPTTTTAGFASSLLCASIGAPDSSPEIQGPPLILCGASPKNRPVFLGTPGDQPCIAGGEASLGWCSKMWCHWPTVLLLLLGGPRDATRSVTTKIRISTNRWSTVCLSPIHVSSDFIDGFSLSYCSLEKMMVVWDCHMCTHCFWQ